MKNIRSILLLVACVFVWIPKGRSAYSSLATKNDDGTLQYSTDANGNRLPDYSYAGYKLGEAPIPGNINIAATVNPVAGDNLNNIQSAINYVQGLSVGPDGFRGVVLLKAGTYPVSGTINITAGGVVLRGEGAGAGGTVILHTGTDQETTVSIAPTAGGIGMTKVADIEDDYVPVGASTFQLDDVSGLSVGQRVFITCNHTQKWIDDQNLTAYWTTANMVINWERRITAIDTAGDRITVDSPLTSVIDKGNGYALGEVKTISSDARLENVGIENILFVSEYNRAEVDAYGNYNDEDHASNAIYFIQAKNCWVQRCVGFFYYTSFVSTWTNCNRITIQDCAMYDGVSLDTPNVHAGSREYYFNINGSNILVQRCFSRGARHAYISNGPKSNIVFLHCYSQNGHLSPEPHQAWTSGLIYDNVYSDSQFKLHGNNISAHGQQAANCALWNCVSENTRWFEPEIWLNRPLCNLAQNWVVGCLINGVHTDPPIDNPGGYGLAGYVESTDTHVEPKSLYMAQFRDRCGDAVQYGNVTNNQYISNLAVYNDMLAKYSSAATFGDPGNLAAWLPDIPAYNLTIADRDSVSLLDEEQSILNWTNATVSTAQYMSGSVSAFWDGVNQDAWKFMTLTEMPTDWSNYDTLKFSMYSAVANNARFVITAVSKNINGSGDYYIYNVDVNWSGWKEFNIPFSSFTAVRSPAGWQKIDSINFCNKGYTAIIKPDTVLYLDNLCLKNSSQDILLDDADTIQNWTKVDPASAYYVSGNVSAKWYQPNVDAYNHVVKTYASPADWSSYDTLKFSMYSAVANDASFAITITSRNTNGDGDYYIYMVDVDWVGWREFSIPFTSFTSVRSPLGWNSIDKISFLNKGCGAIIKPDTELYFDKIRVVDDI